MSSRPSLSSQSRRLAAWFHGSEHPGPLPTRLVWAQSRRCTGSSGSPRVGPCSDPRPPDENGPGPSPDAVPRTIAGDLHRIFDGPRAMMPPVGRVSRRAESGTVRAMEDSDARAERVEALWGLLGRLCAPELTMAEAKSLRTRLIDLLEQIDRDKATVRGTPSQPLAPSTDRDEVPKS